MKMIRNEWKLRPVVYHNSYNPHWQLQLPSDYGGGKRSRWNPTAEQLQALQHMYQSGITTPSAQQIQQIAAKLRKFGKIEGKNVFYWFQNHKARDKRRAQFPHPTGLSKRPRLESEHPSKFPTPWLKCSESMHGGVDQELQEKYSDDVKGRGPYPFVPFNFCKMLGAKNDNFTDLGTGNGIKENSITLELFPIKISNDLSTVEEEESSSCRLVPNQFIEFLPTKK